MIDAADMYYFNLDFPESQVTGPPMNDPDNPDDYCEICTKVIRTMVYRGTGVCSENCRKRKAGEKVTEGPEESVLPG